MKKKCKKYTLGLYEKAVPNCLELRQKLEMMRDNGFDFMELSIDESAEKQSRLTWNKRERNYLSRLSAEILPVTSICFSMQRSFPMGSSDPVIRSRSMEAMEQTIEFAYDTGIRIIQLAGYDVYYEPSTSETEKYFMQNLSIATAMAASRGVILGIETMENDFINTVEKAMKYVEYVGSPYLGLYPDIGNISNAVDNVPADILKGRGHMFSAHLKETKPGIYRNLMFGEGNVDFLGAAKALRSIGVSRFTAEFWYSEGNPEPKLNYAKRFLSKVLDEAFK